MKMSSGAKETGINASIKYDEIHQMNRNGFKLALFVVVTITSLSQLSLPSGN